MMRPRPLTPGTRHLERIERATVPESFAAVLTEYEDTVDARDPFLWNWLYYVFPEIELSCMSSDAGQQVRDTKLLASLYIVLLDDLAERMDDKRTFEEAASVPFDRQTPDPSHPGVNTDVVELASRIWVRITDLLEATPRYDEFQEILLFDLKQTFNAIEHSFLVNHHLELATVEEATTFDSYNMMLFTYANIDLMAAPAFDRSELGTLRKVLRRAQEMARLGNWITTWERELGEGDFTSGVVAAAVEDGVVSREELRSLGNHHTSEERDDVVRRIRTAEIEERFLQQWAVRHREIKQFESELVSVDLEAFVDGMETVLECHLASRGSK